MALSLVKTNQGRHLASRETLITTTIKVMAESHDCADEERVSTFSDPNTQRSILNIAPEWELHAINSKKESQVEMARRRPERFVYPFDPHTKTTEELQDKNSTFRTAPGIIAPIRSLIVEKDHPIVSRWAGFCKDTIEILVEAEIRWRAIECFRRTQIPRKKEGLDDTTIVITVGELPPRTDRVEAVLEKIHVLSGNLFVEIIKGRVWQRCKESLTQEDPRESVRRQRVPYKDRPDMGASIGPEGNDTRSGSLGGFVELFKPDGGLKFCGLTCSHVFKPSLLGGEKEIFEGTENNSAINITYPSDFDHGVATDTVRAARDYYESQMKGVRKRLEDLGESNIDSNKQIRALSRHLERCAELRATAESTDRRIGKTFACSGTRILPEHDCIIDWGLVEMRGDRVGENRFPGREMPKIVFARDPMEGDIVAQTGRTSFTAQGTVNVLPSCVWNDEMGNEARTMEWAIANGQPFSYGEDSGAFVVSQDDPAVVVGLIWGGKDDGLWDVTYFTPITLVAKDILDTTNYHVRLPDGDGEHLCC